jgi:predicted permease
MKRLRRFLARLLSPVRRTQDDRDLDDEVASHIAFQTEDNIRAGQSPEEARRAAILKFGAVESVKESYRDQRHWPFFEVLRLDLRFALRMLRRSPVVGWSAIVVLALGLGTATATYALVYAMWLRPLPYTQPQELVSVSTWLPNFKIDALMSPDYGEWQNTKSIGLLGAFDYNSSVLSAPRETLRVKSPRISGNLFSILGIHPALGRAIQASDDSPAAAPVAMLSHALWRSQFNSDPSLIGRPVPLNGQATTIIGVLPKDFRLPGDRRVDMLLPLSLAPDLLAHGGSGAMRIMEGIGRLQPGADLAQARAEFTTRLANSKARSEEFYRKSGVELRIVPLHERSVAKARTLSLALLAAIACILWIATANIAGLLVARASGRQREMAIRYSLGASHLQIARGLLTEGILLGGIGTALGLALTAGLLSLLPLAGGASLVSLDTVSLDPQVLAAAIATGIFCSLAFSLAPILPLPRLQLRRGLVVLELAASLFLLFGAALLLENLRQLHAVSPGFQTNHLLTVALGLEGSSYAKNPTSLVDELRSRITAIPGVTSLSFVTPVPPQESFRSATFSRPDRPAYGSLHRMKVRMADSNFLATMGIPLRQGRVFSPEAEAGSAREAIINRSLAERYYPGENPIGKQIDGMGSPWKTIVGVAEDYSNAGLRNAAHPELILPLVKSSEGGREVTFSRELSVILRTAGDPTATASALRAQFRQLDTNVLATIRTMDESWDELKAAPRFEAFAFSIFAGLALLMAATGIYGVLSHIVTLRWREIGIRMALGALPRQVQFLILREALVFAGGGIFLGLVAALLVAPQFKSLLFNVNPSDPLLLGTTSALLLLLALLAALAPARRAAQQDPAHTLRSE